MKKTGTFIFVTSILFLSACQHKDDELSTPAVANINFIFKFDSTQARLNALGEPAPLAAGHAAQSPRFNTMSAHYLELAPNANTLLGTGQVLYKAPETTTGGATAIDFSKSKFAGNNQIFLTVPVTAFAAGSYSWLRLSLAYQNYNIYMNAGGASLNATVASFIGFNTYISSYKVKDSSLQVNANRLQGYWALETGLQGVGFVTSGQAPAGATTVPNPLAATSPVPPGSCVVTGMFTTPLLVTGKETKDINIIVSLSTNKSFEWKNPDGNNSYDPQAGDSVVDMGIRGMIPVIQ